VTVDVVVLTIRQGRLAVLLVQRPAYPQRGAWALPGGFVGSQQGLLDAAWQALSRKTGLVTLPEGIHLEQLATYGRPDRDPRMRVISVSYLALTPAIDLPPQVAMAGQARFWPLEDLAGEEMPHLAFDHQEILRDGLERARAKLEYTTVARAFVQEPFTLADLRRVYETVWDVSLDPNNFRRSVFETEGFVLPLEGEVRREHDGGRGRPAALYRKGPAFYLSHVIRRPAPRDTSSPAKENPL
jgi:8-oxo-dGTP diphosphatase